jgi:hypothetical protein
MFVQSGASSPRGLKRPASEVTEYGVYPVQVTVPVFSAMMLLFVSMRVYTRVAVKGNWGPDDCEQAGFIRCF